MSDSQLRSKAEGLRQRFREIGQTPILFKHDDGRIQTSTFTTPTAFARHSVYRTRIRRYPEIRQFFESIDVELGKFRYGTLSDDDWDCRYVFPSARTAGHYAAIMTGQDGSDPDTELDIANWSAKTTQSWIETNVFNDLRIQDRGLMPTTLLIGDVGCGKSTFVKYMLNRFRSDFIDHRVIPSRIECRKLVAEFLEKDEFSKSDRAVETFLPVLHRYFIRNLYRDIAHFAYFSNRSGNAYELGSRANLPYPCIYSTQFEEYCIDLPRAVIEVLGSSGRPDEIVRMHFEAYTRASFEQRPKALPEFQGDDSFRASMEIIVGFYANAGVNFCFIFDGFDYIQAADFLFETPQSRALQLISEWLRSGSADGSVRLPVRPYSVVPKSIISLRHTTYGHFNSTYSQAFGRNDPIISHVSPPSFPDLFAALFNNMNTRSIRRSDKKQISKELFLLLRDVRQQIRRELEIRGQFGFGDLFNGNVRHQTNFVKDILLELAYESLPYSTYGNQITPSQLFHLVRYEWSNFLSRKRYRFVDILLYSLNSRFANFIRISDLDELKTSLTTGSSSTMYSLVKDSNVDSGYIGNIFSYHIPMKHAKDTAFILEKIRILELLCSHSGLTLEQISEQFNVNGWPKSDLLNASLYVLVREGFAYVEAASGRGLFKVLPLGRVTSQHLIKRMVYLENVYFGLVLPSEIIAKSVDIIRAANKIIDWVSGSIVHTFLLLNLIKFAEEQVSSDGQNSPRTFIWARIQPEIESTIAAILSEDLSTQRVRYDVGSGVTITEAAFARLSAVREVVL